MRSLRILIVEDEGIIALDLEDILVEAGHIVVAIASTTAHALRIAANSQLLISLQLFSVVRTSLHIERASGLANS